MACWLLFPLNDCAFLKKREVEKMKGYLSVLAVLSLITGWALSAQAKSIEARRMESASYVAPENVNKTVTSDQVQDPGAELEGNEPQFLTGTQSVMGNPPQFRPWGGIIFMGNPPQF